MGKQENTCVRSNVSSFANALMEVYDMRGSTVPTNLCYKNTYEKYGTEQIYTMQLRLVGCSRGFFIPLLTTFAHEKIYRNKLLKD